MSRSLQGILVVFAALALAGLTGCDRGFNNRAYHGQSFDAVNSAVRQVYGAEASESGAGFARYGSHKPPDSGVGHTFYTARDTVVEVKDEGKKGIEVNVKVRDHSQQMITERTRRSDLEWQFIERVNAILYGSGAKAIHPGDKHPDWPEDKRDTPSLEKSTPGADAPIAGADPQ